MGGRGMRGRMEGFTKCTLILLILFGCLTCSAAPQTTPPGYSHRGLLTIRNTLWARQGKQATIVGGETGRLEDTRRRGPTPCGATGGD